MQLNRVCYNLQEIKKADKLRDASKKITAEH